jgi:hypothetical protein
MRLVGRSYHADRGRPVGHRHRRPGPAGRGRAEARRPARLGAEDAPVVWLDPTAPTTAEIEWLAHRFGFNVRVGLASVDEIDDEVEELLRRAYAENN